MDNQEVKAQTPREKAEAIVSKVISIASIVFFALALVLIWGTIVQVQNGDKTTTIGIGYLLNKGWKDLPDGDTKTTYVIQNVVGIAGLILCGILSLAAGIPGLIASIKHVKSGAPYDGKLAKKAIVVIIGQIIYIALVNIFFSCSGDGAYGTSSLGWAGGMMIGVASLYATGVAGYYCFRAFHKDNVLPFVVRIVSCVSGFTVANIVLSLTGIAFTHNVLGGKIGLGPYMCVAYNADLAQQEKLIGSSLGKHDTLLLGAVIIFILFAVVVFASIAMKKITKNVVEEKEVDHFLPISIFSTALSLVSVVFAALIGTGKFFENANPAVGEGPIGAFACALFFLGCNIAIIVLKNIIAKKAAEPVEAKVEEPKAIEEVPAEEPKAE